MSGSEDNRKWYIDWIEHYSQFFRKDNWYTFTPLWLEVENDWIMGNYELTLVILGLGFRITYHHSETETTREIKSNIDMIEDESSVILSAAEYARLKTLDKESKSNENRT